MCPVLYQKALGKLYSTDTGYQEIFPCKSNARSLKGLSCDEQNERMKSYEHQRSEGGDGDILRIWRKIYHEKGWKRYAPFDSKGGFNTPYMLFKAKNITDPTVRATKWYKGRLIAPGTKHPMRKLLHLAGRAWSFVTANLPGEHFVIQHGGRSQLYYGGQRRLRLPESLGTSSRM